ncbi:uncharacterized protein LOC100901087 [Galendromus occidentalis]|uniref:Uncharacterized protein LOC100901087 n=1 Tax=Galendromus occidentalis TaxID=34638 RepID=A0AAJ6W0B4_9ACAR|nr:uncharacterized protein LOC100901087 [Galendromus occidentalis]
MEWTNLLSANEGLKRAAVIAAVGAGSIYVVYNLLDTYITRSPGTGPAEGQRAVRSSRLRSTTPLKQNGSSTKHTSLHQSPTCTSPAPMSVRESLEIARNLSQSPTPPLPLVDECLDMSHPIEEQTDQLTELVEDLKYNGARLIDGDEVDCLGFLLTTDDESLLCETLGILSNCAAFTPNQDQFREKGVLNQVKKLTRHENDVIKVQALTATSNLCVNNENQAEFFDEIPHYLKLAFQDGTSMVSLVALYVLTNLTVKFGSNPEILKHTGSLASKAVCAAKDESLQAMKILVNISCEEEGAEHLVKADLRDDFFDLIRSEPPISQRCLTLLANLIPKIAEGSPMENRVIQLKGDMLDMWRRDDLEDAQKDQLRRALKALSVRGWGRLSESTMDLVNKQE